MFMSYAHFTSFGTSVPTQHEVLDSAHSDHRMRLNLDLGLDPASCTVLQRFHDVCSVVELANLLLGFVLHELVAHYGVRGRKRVR